MPTCLHVLRRHCSSCSTLPHWSADGGKTPAWNQGFKFPHIYPKVQKVLKVEVRTLVHLLMRHMAAGTRYTAGSGTGTPLRMGTSSADTLRPYTCACTQVYDENRVFRDTLIGSGKVLLDKVGSCGAQAGVSWAWRNMASSTAGVAGSRILMSCCWVRAFLADCQEVQHLAACAFRSCGYGPLVCTMHFCLVAACPLRWR